MGNIHKHINPRKLWFKAIAMGLIVAFLVNQVSYAMEPSIFRKNVSTLSPTSRFIYGDNFVIDTEGTRISELASALKEDAGLLYVSRLIGRVLDSNGTLISAKGLQTLIRRHLPEIEVNTSFILEDLYKEGSTYCLPYVNKDDGSRERLRFYLPSDNPEEAHGKPSMPAGIGDVRIVKENAEEVSDKTPTKDVTSDEYGEEFNAYLAALDKRTRQGTFERALSDKEGKALLKSPKHFLLYAIRVYVGDVPQQDLWVIRNHILSKHKELPSQTVEKITEALNLIESVTRDLTEVLDLPFNLEEVDDTQATVSIKTVLALRSHHIETIDDAIEKIKDAAPELEMVHDMLKYYRGRVVEFFDQFKEESEKLNLGITKKSTNPSKLLFESLLKISPPQGEALEIRWNDDIGPQGIIEFSKYLESLTYLDYELKKYYIRTLLFSCVVSNLEISQVELLKPLGDLLCVDTGEDHMKGHADEFVGQAAAFYPEFNISRIISNMTEGIMDALRQEKSNALLEDALSDLLGRLKLLRKIQKPSKKRSGRRPKGMVTVMDNTVIIAVHGKGQLTFSLSAVPSGPKNRRGIKLMQRDEWDGEELFAYSTPMKGKRGERGLTGIYVSDHLRGKGFFRAFLNIFFTKYPDVKKTHPSVANPALLDMLETHYGFAQEEGIEPNVWFKHIEESDNIKDKTPGQKYLLYYKDANTASEFSHITGREDYYILEAEPEGGLEGFSAMRLGEPFFVKDEELFKQALESFPVEVRDEDRKDKGGTSIRNLLLLTIGIISGIAIASGLAFIGGDAAGLVERAGVFGDIAGGIMAAGIIGAIISSYRGDDGCDPGKLRRTIKQLFDKDEFMRMAAARDLKGMPVLKDTFENRGFVPGVLETLECKAFDEREHEMVREAALVYLSKMHRGFPIGDVSTHRVVELLLRQSTSLALRKEALRLLSGVMYLSPEMILIIYRAVLGNLYSYSETDEDLQRLAVKVFGRLIMVPSLPVEYFGGNVIKDIARAVEEIAEVGTIGISVMTFEGLKRFAIPLGEKAQITAIREATKRFLQILAFLDLVIRVQDETGYYDTGERNVSLPEYIRMVSLAVARDTSLEDAWEKAEAHFENSYLLFSAILNNWHNNTSKVLEEASRSMIIITEKWNAFLLKYDNHSYFSGICWRDLNRFRNILITNTYRPFYEFGRAPFGDNKAINLNLARILSKFSLPVSPGPKHIADAIIPLVFDANDRVSRQASSILQQLMENDPLMRKDQELDRIIKLPKPASRSARKDGAAVLGVLLAAAAVIGLVSAVIFLISKIAPSADVISAALNFVGAGTMIWAVNIKGDDSGVKRSLDAMLARAVRASRSFKENHALTEYVSLVQMVPTHFLTDPDNVDVSVDARRFPSIYILMEKITQGDLSTADMKPIRIDIKKDGTISIYEGQYRLEAFKRVGVTHVPAQVVYWDKDTIGKYPFETIKSDESREADEQESKDIVVEAPAEISELALIEEQTEEVRLINKISGYQYMTSREEEKPESKNHNARKTGASLLKGVIISGMITAGFLLVLPFIFKFLPEIALVFLCTTFILRFIHEAGNISNAEYIKVKKRWQDFVIVAIVSASVMALIKFIAPEAITPQEIKVLKGALWFAWGIGLVSEWINLKKRFDIFLHIQTLFMSTEQADKHLDNMIDRIDKLLDEASSRVSTAANMTDAQKKTVMENMEEGTDWSDHIEAPLKDILRTLYRGKAEIEDIMTQPSLRRKYLCLCLEEGIYEDMEKMEAALDLFDGAKKEKPSPDQQIDEAWEEIQKAHSSGERIRVKVTGITQYSTTGHFSGFNVSYKGVVGFVHRKDTNLDFRLEREGVEYFLGTYLDLPIIDPGSRESNIQPKFSMLPGNVLLPEEKALKEKESDKRAKARKRHAPKKQRKRSKVNRLSKLQMKLEEEDARLLPQETEDAIDQIMVGPVETIEQDENQRIKRVTDFFGNVWEEYSYRDAYYTVKLRSIKTGQDNIEVVVSEERLDLKRCRVKLDGEIVGHFYYNPKKHAIYFIMLKFRNKGIGQTVLNWAAKRAAREESTFSIHSISNPRLRKLAQGLMRDYTIKNEVDLKNTGYMVKDPREEDPLKNKGIGRITVKNGAVTEHTLPEGLDAVMNEDLPEVVDIVSGETVNAVLLYAKEEERIEGYPEPIFGTLMPGGVLEQWQEKGEIVLDEWETPLGDFMPYELKKEKKKVEPQNDLPDGSPLMIFKRLWLAGRYLTVEEIRKRTKGKMPDRHLSTETVEHDLGVLEKLGLIEKDGKGENTTYVAKPLAPGEWEKVEPILEDLGTRPTSDQQESAKEKLQKEQTLSVEFPLKPEYIRSIPLEKETIDQMVKLYEEARKLEKSMETSGFLPQIGEVLIPYNLGWDEGYRIASGNMEIVFLNVEFHTDKNGHIKFPRTKEYIFSICSKGKVVGHGIIYRAPQSGKIRFRYSIHGGWGVLLKRGIDYREKGYGKEALTLLMAAAVNGELFEGEIETFAYSWHASDGESGEQIKNLLREAGFDENLEFSMEAPSKRKKADTKGWGPGTPHITQPPDAEDESESRRLFGPGRWNIYRGLSGYDRILRMAGIENGLMKALTKGGVYVDAGCGVGRAAVEAADLAANRWAYIKVYGVDTVEWTGQDMKGVNVREMEDFSWGDFSVMKDSHQEAGRYTFIQGDISDVKLPEKADVVTSFFVLQYAKDPLRALLNLYNQMNTGGVFYGAVIVPKNTSAADHYESLLKELSQKHGALTTGLMPAYIHSLDALCFIIFLEKTQDGEAATDLVLTSSEERTVTVSGETFNIYFPKYIIKGWGPGTPHITQPPNREDPEESETSEPILEDLGASPIREQVKAAIAEGSRMFGVDFVNYEIIETKEDLARILNSVLRKLSYVLPEDMSDKEKDEHFMHLRGVAAGIGSVPWVYYPFLRKVLVTLMLYRKLKVIMTLEDLQSGIIHEIGESRLNVNEEAASKMIQNQIKGSIGMMQNNTEVIQAIKNMISDVIVNGYIAKSSPENTVLIDRNMGRNVVPENIVLDFFKFLYACFEIKGELEPGTMVNLPQESPIRKDAREAVELINEALAEDGITFRSDSDGKFLNIKKIAAIFSKYASEYVAAKWVTRSRVDGGKELSLEEQFRRDDEEHSGELDNTRESVREMLDGMGHTVGKDEERRRKEEDKVLAKIKVLRAEAGEAMNAKLYWKAADIHKKAISLAERNIARSEDKEFINRMKNVISYHEDRVTRAEELDHGASGEKLEQDKNEWKKALEQTNRMLQEKKKEEERKCREEAAERVRQEEEKKHIEKREEDKNKALEAAETAGDIVRRSEIVSGVKEKPEVKRAIGAIREFRLMYGLDEKIKEAEEKLESDIELVEQLYFESEKEREEALRTVTDDPDILFARVAAAKEKRHKGEELLAEEALVSIEASFETIKEALVEKLASGKRVKERDKLIKTIKSIQEGIEEIKSGQLTLEEQFRRDDEEHSGELDNTRASVREMLDGMEHTVGKKEDAKSIALPFTEEYINDLAYVENIVTEESLAATLVDALKASLKDSDYGVSRIGETHLPEGLKLDKVRQFAFEELGITITCFKTRNMLEEKYIFTIADGENIIGHGTVKSAAYNGKDACLRFSIHENFRGNKYGGKALAAIMAMSLKAGIFERPVKAFEYEVIATDLDILYKEDFEKMQGLLAEAGFVGFRFEGIKEKEEGVEVISHQLLDTDQVSGKADTQGIKEPSRETENQEAQDFIDALINWIEVRALDTGVRGETLIIGIGASWIPEIQRDLASMQNLLKKIEGLSKSKLKGFKNIKVIIEENPQVLADEVWKARKGNDPKAPLTPLSNIIILEEEDVLDGGLFKVFRGRDEDERSFFAKIKLPEDFNEYADTADINIVQIVTQMLEKASLRGASYEFYIELPEMQRYESLHELSDVYAMREEAMIRA